MGKTPDRTQLLLRVYDQTKGLYHGPKRWGELCKHASSPNTLSKYLTIGIEQLELIETTIIRQKGRRVGYKLTDYGQEVYGKMRELLRKMDEL